MLRAHFRRRFKDNMSGIQIENQVYSIPFDNPEIEKELRAGGFGETGFEVRELIGVEVEESTSPVPKEAPAPKPKDPTDEIPHGAIIGMLDDVTLIAHCSADSATLCLSERSRSLAIKALTRPYLSKRYAGMSSQERSQQAYGAIKIAAVVCPELRASLQTPDWAKRT